MLQATKQVECKFEQKQDKNGKHAQVGDFKQLTG